VSTSARRWLIWIGATTGCALILPFIVVAGREFLAVDGCLDAGGSFDYLKQTCDFSQNHAYLASSVRHRALARAAMIGCVTLVAVAGFVIAFPRKGMSLS
jgi:hypothetical protein